MKTQNELIKKHLLSGRSISPMVALRLYKCFRLASRIYDLKEAGMQICSETVRRGKKSHSRYFIAQ